MSDRGYQDELTRGNPVAISFCGYDLKHGYGDTYGLRPFNKRGPNILCAQNCGCSPHAAVVVGRVSYKGACYLKVRNSWGDSCAGYDDSIKPGCKDGDFFMPESELQTNGMTYSNF